MALTLFTHLKFFFMEFEDYIYKITPVALSPSTCTLINTLSVVRNVHSIILLVLIFVINPYSAGTESD